MLPSMYVAMALRRQEYEGDHREHRSRVRHRARSGDGVAVGR
jgi:hypothetical protein